MYKNDENILSGWVKSVIKPIREFLNRVDELRAELANLKAETQLREMEECKRLEALVKIRNLMRTFELMPADLGPVATSRRRGRPRKVAS